MRSIPRKKSSVNKNRSLTKNKNGREFRKRSAAAKRGWVTRRANIKRVTKKKGKPKTKRELKLEKEIKRIKISSEKEIKNLQSKLRRRNTKIKRSDVITVRDKSTIEKLQSDINFRQAKLWPSERIFRSKANRNKTLNDWTKKLFRKWGGDVSGADEELRLIADIFDMRLHDTYDLYFYPEE